jgi:4-hydroxy-3-methylbut-2-enyl diphosphate reductase
MGPSRARKAAARLASVLPDGLPVVVLGVGGALTGGFAAGDLVVANALGTADADGGELVVTRRPVPLDARSSAFSDQVAAALSARFPSTRQAPTLSAGRTAKGPARSVLAESGAVVCDTESYWLSRLSERRPFAVVRSVVDSPDRELLSLQTFTGGVVGLKRLADVARVLTSLLARDVKVPPRQASIV